MNLSEVYAALAADARSGELAFPTSARVALKILKALEDPECSLEAAGKLVQAEPLLAARVVAMANSVAYNRSGRAFTDVRTALSRLGFKTLNTLTMALVTRQLAGTPQAPHQKACAGALWEHTAHVAALAHLIAQKITSIDPDTALFAGILHEVGGFFLISRSKDQPELLADANAPWLDEGERLVGEAVLDVLQVPNLIRQGIGAYWDGFMAMPPVSLGDTLLLADALSPIPSPLHGPGGRVNGQGLMENISLVIGQETLDEILATSAEHVDSLTKALSF